MFNLQSFLRSEFSHRDSRLSFSIESSGFKPRVFPCNLKGMNGLNFHGKLREPKKSSTAVYQKNNCERIWFLYFNYFSNKKLKLTYIGSSLCFFSCIMSKYSLNDVCVSPLPPLRTMSSDVPLSIDH